MNHPDQGTLALFAGGDLGLLGRAAAARHIRSCERCQAEVARFEALRNDVEELRELPGVAWNVMAAEMSANIRLGLAAGAIVDGNRSARRSLWHPRSLVATGCVAGLLLACLWLQFPAPPLTASGSQGVVLESTQDGISVRYGDQTMTLINGRGSEVMYTTGAQGVMRARYVDSDTGQVTINNVYVE
jgi:hypothetical protein